MEDERQDKGVAADAAALPPSGLSREGASQAKPAAANAKPCRWCNGGGWYTSYVGGIAHPLPCDYCNQQGLSPA